MNQTDHRITQLEDELCAVKVQLEQAERKNEALMRQADLEKLSRFHAEQELIVERDRLKSIGNNLPNGVLFRWEVNLETQEIRYTYLSETWTKITGLDLQRSLDDVPYSLSKILPEDLEIVTDRMYKSVTTLEPYFAEIRINHIPSGEIRWLQIAAHPRHVSENHIIYDGFFFDITTRKHAEQELLSERDRIQSIGDNFPGGALFRFEMNMLTNERRYTYLSAKWEKMIGLSREESMTDITKVFARILPEYFPLFMAEMQRCMVTLEPLFFEFEYDKDNETVWLQISAHPHRTAENYLIYDGFVLDITARKEVEAELNNYRERLEFLVKERTEELGVANEELFASNEELQTINEELNRYQTRLEDIVVDKTAELIARQEDLEKISHTQAILIKVLQIVQSAENLPQAMNESLAEIGKYAGVSRVNVFEKNLDESTINNTFEWCNDGIESIIDFLQNIPVEIPRSFFDMFDAGIYTGDSDNKMLVPELSEMLISYGVKSFVVFPLSLGIDNYGFVVFDECTASRDWDENEVELLKSLSQIISATKRRFRAEQELVVERDRLRAIGDNFPGGALFRLEINPKTKNLHYTYLSETWTEITGLEIQKSLNNPIYSFSNILPEDLEKLMQRVYDFGNTQNYNSEVRMNHTPSGELRWLQIAAHLYHISENLIIYDGFILDITARKLAEQELNIERDRLQAIGDNFPGGSLFRLEINPKTKNLRYTYLSETWSEITGLDIQRSLNDPIYSFSNILPDDLEVLLKRVNDFGNTQNYNSEVRMNHTPSGELRWLQIAAHIYHISENLIIYDGFILDITARKHAEQELLSERDRIQSIGDNFPGGALFRFEMNTLTNEMRYTYLSAKWEKMIGLSREESMTDITKVFARILPEYFPLFMAEMQRCIVMLEPLFFEFEYNKDNETVWLQISAHPHHTAENCLIYDGFVLDITARKLAEQELLLERDRIQSIGDNFPGGALFRWEVDCKTNDMHFTYLSKTWTDITGLEVQRSLDDVLYSFSTIVPEDAEILMKSINGFNDSLVVPETYDSTYAEVRINHPSGKIRWLQIVSHPHIVSEKNIIYNGFILDITEHKNVETAMRLSQQTMRTVLENIDASIMVNEYDSLQILFANNKFRESTGIDDAEGRLCWQSIKAELKAPCKQCPRAALLDSNGIPTGVHHRESYNPVTGRWHIIMSTAINWVNGQLAIMELATDITSLKQNEAELVHARERAEESDKLKSAFLANMSHEIRTPLNAIVGFINIIAAGELSQQEEQDCVNIINKNASQLTKLIDDILDVSKIEAKQMSLLPVSTNINQLMTEMQVIFKTILQTEGKQQIMLILDKSGSVDNCVAMVDPLRLQQILSNLIGNAIKYTENGYIRFGYRQPAPDKLEFFVKDTGIGMTPEISETVFERFRKLGSRKFYQGVGLGLNIAQSFVKMMGGDIWLETNQGAGSSFYFTISYVPAEGVI